MSAQNRFGLKDKVKSLHNFGLVQYQSLDFLNMRRADINYSNLFFAYQISCLVLVLFNAFCITMYDDVGN